MDTDRAEAMQAVVDRVSSYQDAAPESTLDKELREAFGETDLEVTEQEVAALVAAIDEHGEVSVASVLGTD
ncbi:hypothetical protein GCM10011519_28460 [Marmoricola endophyticus]|uniref:Uncharacterized protein n=1 Tax=Marmoricola endophyticus TaxID=2040280 RepID=A0A917BNB3_9ACTN|nr:hypothetical protein [Marmoricola endophyticus]GGF52783.1 hypothetical protein GCM10011519_28460 [Marmoricola endophyticus]